MKSHYALASKTSRLSSRSLSSRLWNSSISFFMRIFLHFKVAISSCIIAMSFCSSPFCCPFFWSVVRFLLCFPDFQLNRQCFFLLSLCLFSAFVQCVFVMLRGFHCQILDRKVDFKFSKVLNILAVLCTSNVLFLNASWFLVFALC